MVEEEEEEEKEDEEEEDDEEEKEPDPTFPWGRDKRSRVVAYDEACVVRDESLPEPEATSIAWW